MKKPNYFKAWLIFFLVGTIGGLIVGMIVGGFAGFALTILNAGDPSVVASNQFLFQVGGFLLGIPISFLVYKWSVSKYIIPQLEDDSKTHLVEQSSADN